MAATWVFGYGSLVDRRSLSATLQREVVPHAGWHEAVVEGWSRRWNYGIGHVVGYWLDGDGREREMTIVALGVAHDGGSANGIVVRVDPDELARLDHRERHYDRVDVTDATVVVGGVVTELDGPVITYVPRPEAIERYERARDVGGAAIERRYWNLVDAAFGTLGADRQERYRSSTPAPDVPVLDIRRA